MVLLRSSWYNIVLKLSCRDYAHGDNRLLASQIKEVLLMKSTYETMGGKYQHNADFLLPNFEVPESPEVGVWGERRRKYLREHQQALYTAMMLSDTLNSHLEEIDRTAIEMFDRLTLQLTKQEGITEQLKATNQMEWVQQMNNVRNRAAEVVWKELICV